MDGQRCYMVRNSFNEGNKMTSEKLKLIYKYMGWFFMYDYPSSPEKLDSNSAWKCVQELTRRGAFTSFEAFAFEYYEGLQQKPVGNFLTWIFDPENFFDCFASWLEGRSKK